MSKTQHIQGGTYQGNAVIMLASTYPTLMSVVLECIQNAIDSLATGITVTCNLKSKRLTVRDDGEGVTKEKMNKCISSIANSIKKDDKLGRFGLGLISPLKKCEFFTFVSTPKNDNTSYFRWIFEAEKIEGKKEFTIPMCPVEDIYFGPGATNTNKGRKPVSWRTEISMEKIISDRIVGKFDLEEMADLILERFSEAMKRRKSVVLLTLVEKDGTKKQLEVRPAVFDGERLKPVIYQNEICGETKFEMHLARKKAKGGRQGKVLVGIKGNDYRISFRDFSKSLDGLLSSEVISALCSGVFEGNILSERCDLHPGRKGFVVNEKLLEFCVHLEKWMNEIGLDHIQRIQDIGKDERYQALGMKSIAIIENMLTAPEFEHLKNLVKSFKFGTVGKNHAEFPIRGIQVEGSKAIQGSGERKSPTIPNEDKNKPKTPRSPETDHPEHTPFSVFGGGKHRGIVKGHSTGLQFAWAEMPGKKNLWEFNKNYGILTFNTRHPLWEQAERKDRVLMRFQEHIAIKALNLEIMPEEWRTVCQEFVDQELPGVLFLIMNEPNQFGRTKKQTKKAA